MKKIILLVIVGFAAPAAYCGQTDETLMFKAEAQAKKLEKCIPAAPASKPKKDLKTKKDVPSPVSAYCKKVWNDWLDFWNDDRTKAKDLMPFANVVKSLQSLTKEKELPAPPASTAADNSHSQINKPVLKPAK